MVGAISPMGLVLCCCLIGHLAVPMIVVPVVALALPGKGFTLGWTRSPSPTILFALGKAQTKQALLLQKLQVAKQQQQSNEKASATNDNVTKRLPDESPQNPDYRADQNRQENNQQQQLAEFAALLSQHAPPKEPKERPFIQPEVALVQGAVEKLLAPKLSPPPPPKPKGAPPSRRKKQGSNANTENMNDTNLVVALQQGDVSERRHFESLQCVFSNRPIGPIGAAQMVPWVPPFLSQTMIVVADPRPRSSEWRAAVQFLEGAMASAAAFDQSKKLSTTNTAATAVVVVAITVDSPDETLAYVV